MYCDLNLPYEQPFSVVTAAPLVSTAQKRALTVIAIGSHEILDKALSLLCAVGFAGLAFNFIVDAPLKPKHVGRRCTRAPLCLPNLLFSMPIARSANRPRSKSVQ